MKQRVFFIALFLIGLAIGAYYFSDFVNTQSPQISDKFTTSFTIAIVVAVFIQLTGHYLRAYKSGLLINRIRPTTSNILFRGVSIGFLFNTLLPWRLGEVIRAIYIGDTLSISKTAVFASIIIERIIDGFILGICFVGSAYLIKSSSEAAFSHLLNIGFAVLFAAILLSILIYAIYSENRLVLRSLHKISGIFNRRISNRIRFIAWSGIYGTKLMLSGKGLIARYLVLSAVMWLLYFTSTAIVVLAFFDPQGFSHLIYTIESTYAGLAVPAGPGYLGTFHLTVSQLLSEVDLQDVGSFSLIVWAVMVIPISIIGLATLISQRFGEKKARSKEELLINKLHREHNVGLELRHFLDAYFKGEKINQILTNAELVNKFKVIKSFKGGSNAHTMLVWENGEKRVKKITLPQFADKLQAQAEWLKARQKVKNFPAVTGEDRNQHYYEYDLAFHEDYYPFFDYIHSHSSKDNYTIVKNVIKLLDKTVYKDNLGKTKKSGSLQKVNKYIDNKILQKMADTATLSGDVDTLMAYETICVNGVEFDNLAKIVDRIRNHKQAMADLANYDETVIHGDMTVDNLIASDEGDFLLLDPNNENDISTKAVDIGKLYQSLHSGYEFLIKLRTCQINANKISFNDSKSHKYADLYELFSKDLSKKLPAHTSRTILFHEGVHYCRMLTYRANINPATVAVFYGTAVKLLNEFMDQYEAN